jgi:HTH-type transcriptional regulator/antitoxin HigA
MTIDKYTPEEWEDFSVSSSEGRGSARDYFESYRLYKEVLDGLPKNELIKRGWITSKDDNSSLINLYRDIHKSDTSALFRKSNTASNSLASLWLSKIKSQAEVESFIFSVPKFRGVDKKQLREIAQTSVDITGLENIKFIRALPSMKLDGAVFKLPTGTPVIGMTLRYSRLDNFWFTLLHELAHIALHYDILGTPILDDLDVTAEDDIEISANRLAKNSIVDRNVWRSCPAKYDKSFDAILKFSKKIKVHESIVAGLLRREEGNYAAYSSIVNKINTRKFFYGHD